LDNSIIDFVVDNYVDMAFLGKFQKKWIVEKAIEKAFRNR